MATVPCRSCGHPVEPGALYCDHCGADRLMEGRSLWLAIVAGLVGLGVLLWVLL